MTGAGLTGHRVLVPRPAPEDPIAAAVRAAGGCPLSTELVRTEVAEPAALDAAVGELVAGGYRWLAVTSATTVQVLAERVVALGHPPAALTQTTQVAAVGPGTAAALQAHGIDVDLLPGSGSSAAALAEAWPAAPDAGRVLLPRSAIAAPTLATGLRRQGWLVTDVVAYTTRTAPVPDPAVRAGLDAGEIDVVLLTSGSTARALVELYGPPPPTTRVCVIGASTAEAADRAGLPVHAVAGEQTPDGLVAAAAHALTAPRPEACR